MTLYTTLFLTALSAERGASGNTLESYERDLTHYTQFLNAQNTDPKHCTTDHIRSYLKSLSSTGLKSTSLARRLSAIRQMHGFLMLESHRTDNPTLPLDSPKLPKPLPKILTIEQVDTLLSIAHQDTSKQGIRLTCVLEMLYATGLRISELITLNITTIQGAKTGKNPWVAIKGKGGKERMVHLSTPACEALRAYLDVRDHFRPNSRGGSPYLFPSDSNQGYVTRQNVGQQLKKLALQAGLPPEQVSPHVLRHAFASHMLAGGADLRAVQTLLGHTHITTTQVYTHIADQRLIDAVQTNHPLSKSIAKTAENITKQAHKKNI